MIGATLIAPLMTPVLGFAVALVPPLAAAGVTFSLAGFGAYRSARVKAEGLLAGAVIVALLVVIAGPLAYNAVQTYGLSDRNRLAADTVRVWDPSLTIDRLIVDPTRDPTRVTIELSGEVRDQEPGMLARRLGNQVDLAISFRPLYRGLSGTDEPD